MAFLARKKISVACFFTTCVASMVLTNSISIKAEWTSISGITISPRRSGHTAFTYNNGQSTFVFGGYIEEDPAKEGEQYFREVRNDLWKFGNDVGEGWARLQPSGDIPGPRLATASAVINDKAYLFGGWDPQTPGTGGVILDSVHALDLNTLEWSYLMDLPDGPTSRHIVLALPAKSENDGLHPKILLHSFRSTDHVWIFDPNEGFTKQPTTGDSPGSLGLHAAAMLDENTMLLFGGAAKDGVMSNKSYILNTKTWEWKQVNLGDNFDNCPSPRAGACIVAYKTKDGKKCGILFGGAETTGAGLNPKGDVWALHLSDEPTCKGAWELLLNDKEGGDGSPNCWPEPRNAATLTAMPSTNEPGTSKFLLTGGWAPFRRTWDDLFVLSLKEGD